MPSRESVNRFNTPQQPDMKLRGISVPDGVFILPVLKALSLISNLCAIVIVRDPVDFLDSLFNSYVSLWYRLDPPPTLHSLLTKGGRFPPHPAFDKPDMPDFKDVGHMTPRI